MSKKIDDQGSHILAIEGKGPWDSDDSADTGASGNANEKGGRSKSDPALVAFHNDQMAKAGGRLSSVAFLCSGWSGRQSTGLALNKKAL